MNALKGTLRLLRLDLRIDRIKLPIWIGANIGILALTIPQLAQAYPDQQARTLYALTTSSSVVSRMLGGALTGTSLGEITVVETFLLIALLVALMNIFLVSRHTRQNEETGRMEVIGSTPTGHQSALTAALLLALKANILTGLLVFLVYQLNNLPLDGSLAYSSAIALMGMFFAGVSAVTCQLFENTRTANGIAGLVFAIAFMLRAIGDALGQLLPGGLGVQSNAVSWLSPLGWVTNMLPFNNEKWWVLGLFAGSILALVAASYILLDKRDVGSGLFAPKRGKLHAAPYLLKRFGLSWRLNRTSSISWLTGLVISGAALGAVANEFADMIAANEEMQKLLAELGNQKDVTNLMFGATFSIVALAVTAYAIQMLIRMRAEETNGRLEIVMSTSQSRWHWLATNFIYTLVTACAMLLLTGFAAGLVYGIIVNDIWTNIRSLTGSITVYIPAIGVMIGVALVLFGKLPKYFAATIWALLAACLLIFQLGVVLDLPRWVMNLSPFMHTPPVPAVSIKYEPLIWQSAVALVLTVLGFILFRRRDIASD